MTDTAKIKTNPDGSIDTGYYMARGRHMRSVAAHDMARGAKRGLLRRVFTLISGLYSRRHIDGRQRAH